MAATLTPNDVDDGSQVGPLLDQVDGQIASFTGDGAYDQDGVYASISERHPGGRYHRATTLNRRAEPDGCERADPARPLPPAHRRAGPQGVAASLRLHEAGPRRASFWPPQELATDRNPLRPARPKLLGRPRLGRRDSRV